nr:uncharacterized protein LOC112772480 [Arachis hypogaea]
MKSIQQHYQFIQENGLPKGFTHFLGSFQPPPPAPLFSGLCYYRHRPIRHSLPVSAHLAASLLSSFSPSFILSISVLSSLFSLRVVVSAVVLRLPFIFHFQSSNRASASGTYLTSAIHIIFLEQTRFRLLEPTTKH